MRKALTVSDLIKFADDFENGTKNFASDFVKRAKDEEEKLNRIVEEKNRLESGGVEEKLIKLRYNNLLSDCDNILFHISDEWLNTLYGAYWSEFNQRGVLIYFGFLLKDSNFRESVRPKNTLAPFIKESGFIKEPPIELMGEELKKKAFEYSGKAKKWGKKLLKSAKKEGVKLLKDGGFSEYRKNLRLCVEKVKKELEISYREFCSEKN